MRNKYIIDINYILIAWKKYKHSHSSETSEWYFDLPGEIVSKKKPNHRRNQEFRKWMGKKFLNNLKKSLSKNKVDPELENEDTISQFNIIDDDNGSESLESNFEENLEIIKNYLWKFKLSQDTGSNDQVNLLHVLRALPKRINNVNISKIDLINFSLVQKSIIGFQNDDQDELFKYYDRRNKNRMQDVQISGKANSDQAEMICNRATIVYDKLKIHYGISYKNNIHESESYLGYDQKSESEI